MIAGKPVVTQGLHGVVDELLAQLEVAGLDAGRSVIAFPENPDTPVLYIFFLLNPQSNEIKTLDNLGCVINAAHAA